jgi:uncharacterized protein YbjT (DUF2867 family)
MFVVTGASGNTGSVVADRLLAAGKKVYGISRSADHLRRFEQEGGTPLVAQLTDVEALAEAFREAEGVYLMIPPDTTARDVRAQQDAVTDAYAEALERSKVKNVVALSSIGADKSERTGPVVGLHRMEERLSRIAGLNILFLRAGYFMENLLAQMSVIQKLGKLMGPLRPELKLPMIATRDIGAAAAEALLKCDFEPGTRRELLGQRDLCMDEATEIIAAAIEQPELFYTQASDDDVHAAMLQMGMSSDFVRLILEMSAALNARYMRALEPRSEANTTLTSFETFVEQEFLPFFHGRLAA